MILKTFAADRRRRLQRREEHYTEDGDTVLGHVVMLDPEGNEFCVA